jgi:hypothetical protein
MSVRLMTRVWQHSRADGNAGCVTPALMSSVPAPSPATGFWTGPIPSAPALGEGDPAQRQRGPRQGCRTLADSVPIEFLMRV